jgi:hypothetical protein
MIPQYAENLKSLRGFKFDWARSDCTRFVVATLTAARSRCSRLLSCLEILRQPENQIVIHRYDLALLERTLSPAHAAPVRNVALSSV